MMRIFIDNPLDINDRDSFHWHAEIAMRLIEMYGSDGNKNGGLITKETEAPVLKPIWEYVRKVSWLEKAEHDKSEYRASPYVYPFCSLQEHPDQRPEKEITKTTYETIGVTALLLRICKGVKDITDVQI